MVRSFADLETMRTRSGERRRNLLSDSVQW
jgi:hypothetical protein